MTADRNITAEGEVHFRVAQRLCKLRNRGTSGNSCTKKNKVYCKFARCNLTLKTLYNTDYNLLIKCNQLTSEIVVRTAEIRLKAG